MRHSTGRPRRARGWLPPAALAALVVLGPGPALGAGERKPHASQSAQSSQTRTAVPSSESQHSGGSQPGQSTRASETRRAVPRSGSQQPESSSPQAPPTARDTRQIPPEQYRRPPADGKPPAGGHPPTGGSGHWWGGYPYWHYRPYYYPYWGWSWGWGWGWRVPYWYPFWYGAPYWVYPTPSYQVRHVATDLGGLDLNVKPKKAAVYVDGEYVGMAKEFDGYPGYLWLATGDYRVTLFMPGYRTVTHEFEIRPGQVFDVRIRMQPGEAIPPPEPQSASGVPARAEGSETTPATAAASPAETGTLQFLIRPDDASVYLDDRFVGSAAELGSLHAGLIVGAGRHKVEVVRPGYTTRELEVFVEPGEEVDLKVDLGRLSSR